MKILKFQQISTIHHETDRRCSLLEATLRVSAVSNETTRSRLTCTCFCVQLKMQFKQNRCTDGQLNVRRRVSCRPHAMHCWPLLCNFTVGTSMKIGDEESEWDELMVKEEEHRRLLVGRNRSDSLLSVSESSRSWLINDRLIFASENVVEKMKGKVQLSVEIERVSSTSEISSLKANVFLQRSVSARSLMYIWLLEEMGSNMDWSSHERVNNFVLINIFLLFPSMTHISLSVCLSFSFFLSFLFLSSFVRSLVNRIRKAIAFIPNSVNIDGLLAISINVWERILLNGHKETRRRR